MQRKYATKVLSRASMTNCNPSAIPLAPKHNLTLHGGVRIDATCYRSLVGALQYLTLTRPDLSHAVNLVCQFMHQPTTLHFQAVKCILWNPQGTISHGLRILATPSLNLYIFFDADWGGCLDTRRSTSGSYIFHGANCIFWSSKK